MNNGFERLKRLRYKATTDDLAEAKEQLKRSISECSEQVIALLNAVRDHIVAERSLNISNTPTGKALIKAADNLEDKMEEEVPA